MLVKSDQTQHLCDSGLTFRRYGPVADGAASATMIEVPPNGCHPQSYSSRCDKLYLMLEGALRFDVDGIAYVARAGDMVIVPKGQVSHYFDWQGQPARMLLVHVPSLDATAEHVLPNVLRTHDFHLQGERVTLRPMTEDDWAHVCAWNADAEVLSWTDGPQTKPRTPEETQWIHRTISVFAYIFIIELEGQPIGDIWLQKLNLPEIRERFPGRDLRRIDVELGRKELWGKGLGADAIRTLLRFAFEQEGADGVYYGVERHNPRSRRAAEKAGFQPLGDEAGLIAWRQP